MAAPHPNCLLMGYKHLAIIRPAKMSTEAVLFTKLAESREASYRSTSYLQFLEGLQRGQAGVAEVAVARQLVARGGRAQVEVSTDDVGRVIAASTVHHFFNSTCDLQGKQYSKSVFQN